MPSKIYKTVAYCRLSKEDGDKIESNSILNQKMYCVDFIHKQNDMEMVRLPIVDDGVSGVSFDRSGFRELEQEIYNQNVDCVVVKDLSRFSRNYIDAGRYLERILPSLGVRFVAINDNYDSMKSDSSVDDFVLPFKNLINDAYCKDISVKIRSSLLTRWQNGQFVGAFPPYGYTKNPHDKHKLIVDENVALNVQLAFAMYKNGVSIGRIADKFNEMGILSPLEYKHSVGSNFDTVFKTSKVAKWDYKAIQRVLTNEVYLGHLVQGKQGSPNYKVKISRAKDPKDWVKAFDTHEAIISQEDFRNVARMMLRDTRSLARGDVQNVLSGFVFCGECGDSMVRKTVSSKGKQYHYYVCSNNKNNKGCFSHSVSVGSLERLVFDILYKQIEIYMDFACVMDNVAVKNYRLFSHRNQRDFLVADIEKYREILGKSHEDLHEGVVDKEEFCMFQEIYTQKIYEKESIIRKIDGEELAVYDLQKVHNERVEGFCEVGNIGRVERGVLVGMLDKVYVFKGRKVEVEFIYGDNKNKK